MRTLSGVEITKKPYTFLFLFLKPWTPSKSNNLYLSELFLCCFLDFLLSSRVIRVLPRQHSGKESVGQCKRCTRCRFNPWLRQTPWSRKFNPLKYSCLKNSMDRGAQWATIHEVAKSQTRQHTSTVFILFQNILVFSTDIDKEKLNIIRRWFYVHKCFLNEEGLEK